MSAEASTQQVAPNEPAKKPKERKPAKPPRQTPFADRADDGLIRERDLLPVVSVSASTLWRRVKAGAFPKPIKLGERATAWRVGQVREWLASVGGPGELN